MNIEEMFEGFDPIKQQEHEKYLVEYFSIQVQSRFNTTVYS